MWLDQSSRFTPGQRLEAILRTRDRQGESRERGGRGGMGEDGGESGRVCAEQQSVSRLSRNFSRKELDVPERRFRRVQKWTHHKLERTQRGREAFQSSSIEPKASYRNVVVDTYRGPVALDVLQPTCGTFENDTGRNRSTPIILKADKWAPAKPMIPGVILVSTLESMRSGCSPLNMDKILGRRKTGGRRTSISCATFTNDYSDHSDKVPGLTGTAMGKYGSSGRLQLELQKEKRNQAAERREKTVRKLEQMRLLREQQDTRRQTNTVLARVNMQASRDPSEMSPWDDKLDGLQ
jgi:hypothetical protein